MRGKRYSTKKAAEFLSADGRKIKPSTLERWRCQGIGPRFIKMGKFVVYAEEDLLSYLDGQVRTSTTEKTAA